MKIIVNEHIVNNTIESRWGNAIGGNHRPHRIRSYNNITESSLMRIVRECSRATVNTYSGEEGQGYIRQTTYNL